MPIDSIRRENLVFLGISEDIGETTERTEVKLRNVLETKMKITNAQGMEFQRCHRIGRGQKGKSRDIIVRLLRYPDRVKIWDSRFNLKNTDAAMAKLEWTPLYITIYYQ